jgi:hypothetical protein
LECAELVKKPIQKPIKTGALLDQLRFRKAQAEEAYRRMYEAKSSSESTGHYSDAKESLHQAIRLAHRLRLTREEERLKSRLAEIKSIFRQQFPV